jgi:hypothetical protein
MLGYYITDHGVAPAQDGPIVEGSEFYSSLSPYMFRLPIKDPWGEQYQVFCGTACIGKYSISEAKEDDFLVVSYGRDRTVDYDFEYDPLNEEAGLFVVFSLDDFNKDIINYNGSFIQIPLYHGKEIVRELKNIID